MASGVVQKPIRKLESLYSNLGLPTTPTEISCNWDSYSMLVITALQYGNRETSVVVDNAYMHTTASQNRIILYQTDGSGRFYQIYKGKDGQHLYVYANTSDDARGIEILGSM